MDSISGLIVLFIIIGLIEKFAKKPKANRNAAAGGQQNVQRKPAKPLAFEDMDDADEEPGELQTPVVLTTIPAPSAVQSAAAVQTLVPEPLARTVFERAPLESEKTEEKLSLIEQSVKAAGKGKRRKKAVLQSGESVTDENGCIGGSLGAHAEEGETHAEHAEHVMKRDEALAAEASVARQAAALRAASVSELRRAVVLAEILDKPVSLRRRA